MAFDLVRVLLAAVLVGVLPGYFWARLLFAVEDPFVRVAYGVGLSITLVSAVVLVPARLMGLGVTLAGTVVCATAVLAAGLVAYLRVGGGKEPDAPPSDAAAPLSFISLVPLVGALALAAAAGLGAIDFSWAFLPVGLLVVSSGLLYLIAPRGPEESLPEEAPRDEGVIEPPGESASATARYTLLSLVLVAVLGRGFIGPVLQDWPYIRGVDHYSHAVMANQMLAEGEFGSYLIYPPGFHTMTAMISLLSGLDPIDVFPVLGPLLFVLPALALYVLGSQLWGWEYGILAALFGGFFLGGSYLYFNDSMYPNLVTSQFLMVLAIAALVRLYRAPSWRTGGLLALLGSSVVLYHQVSSLYLALLLGLVGAFFLPHLLLYERRKGLTLTASFALLGALGVVYAWDTYDLPQVIAGMLGTTEASETGEAVDMAIGTQIPYEPARLAGRIVTQPVAWLGLLGAFLLLAPGGNRTDSSPALARLTLLLWTLVLLAGSLTSLSGFPQRFGRDVGIPLSLLAAFALLALLRSLWLRGTLAVFLASLAVLLAGALLGLQADRTLKEASSGSPQMVISEEIYAAGEWLGDNNTGGNIMVSPHVNQVPSRVMLALGGYTGLQSFEAGQIDTPRDLPPTGPEPLRDVLWVLQNPEDDQTRQILAEHDVRYVVLYKDMPDRFVTDAYWPAFEARPDLYRPVFENEDVLIVEPEFG